ncbi:MAG: hypothetical protein ACXADH_10335 [Candidatus Kariarchaeaceae archaeon]
MSNGKKRNYVYLAGYISDDPKTYKWRETFIEMTKDEPNIVAVNPCGNAFNQAVLKEHGEARAEMIGASQHILRAKDFQMVKMSNVMVVNLKIFSGERPLIGTIQELVWARDLFNLPVIGICGTEPNVYTTHPWIEECVSLRVDGVYEAVGAVKFYFLDY